MSLLPLLLALALSADPDGVTRIVVEAEDMQGVDWQQHGPTAPAWRVGRAGVDHFQNNTFGGHWQSRNATAMCDDGDSPAPVIAKINVPKAGRYKIWAKYECPPNFNYAFEITAEGPNGERIFQKTFGLIESPKHFSFTKKLTTGSLYWAWGIDHDAAEGYELDLPAGEVKLTLNRAANPAPAAPRSVDAIMITDDLAEISSPRYDRYPLLDELRRDNDVYVRFRLDAGASGPATFKWDRWAKRYADFYTVMGEYMGLVRFFDESGNILKAEDGTDLVVKSGQWPNAVAPGASTPWMNIGPCLNVESAATFNASTDVEGAAFTMDVALAPDASKIVKSFTMTSDEPRLVLLLQPDLSRPEGVDHSMKLIDVYRMVAAELDKQPLTAPMPTRMRFFSSTGSAYGYGVQPEGADFDVAMNFRRAQGLNTVPGYLNRKAYEGVVAWHAANKVPLMHSMCYQHSQDPDKVIEMVRKDDVAEPFYYLSYGDEIGLPAVDVKDEAVVAAFQAYLKEQGVTLQELGILSWDQVKPLSAMSTEVAVQIGVIPSGSSGEQVDRLLKKLYWHSVQFRIHRGVEEFAVKTAKLREVLGSNVQTTANLGGMHPFYWVHQSSFIESFKHNAMTLAWSEDYDYTQPETSRLCVEYLAAYLKAGTKYNKQRMQFYCMPHYPGQSPEHLLHNAVMLWSQNVKDLDWFASLPDGFSTENYVNFRGGMDMFRMLRTVSDMAGAVEEHLEPAQPVDAKVAILLSEASDVWELRGQSQWGVTPDSEATNAFNEERKNTYNVLRLAGYRVDLITEADVLDGYLDRYVALYVNGENLDERAAPKIVEWVHNGGILYASGGAARKNQYDEPFTALDDVLGRAEPREYTRYHGALRSKIELLFLNPLGKVAYADGSGFDALATLERFNKAGNAQTIATLADGSPAMVSMNIGSGAGYYVATFPGEAWAKKALPLKPAGRGGPESSFTQFEPTDFDESAGSAILMPLRNAGIRPDLFSDKSMVVLNRLHSDKSDVVTAVNLVGAQQRGPVKDLTIAVDLPAAPARVWSYHYRAGLESHFDGHVLAIKMPELDLADVIVIETH